MPVAVDPPAQRTPDPSPVRLAPRHSPVVFALDEVTDPHNLGACLRSAWLLGVDGVVLSQRNCAPLSPAASRASAGALEHMAAGPVPRIALVRNLATALQALQQVPRQPAQHSSAAPVWWRVLAAAAAADSVTACAPRQLGRREGVGQLIVLGSEGKGVRTNVLAACAGGVVAIPHARGSGAGSASLGAVDSLNVSVAAGLLMYHAAAVAPAAHCGS